MRDRIKGLCGIALVVSLCLTGCAKGADAAVSHSSPQPSIEERPTQTAPVREQAPPKKAQGKKQDPQQRTFADASRQDTPDKAEEEVQKNVDLDLTGFSQNMLYAEVCNMGYSPQDYTGKVIKLTGEFAHFQNLDENQQLVSDQDILVCMVTDAMACCATGVEFVPAAGSSFCEPYPEDRSRITVTGVCEITVDESGFLTIIRLHDAQVELAK